MSNIINEQIQIITEQNLFKHLSVGKVIPSTKTFIIIVKKGEITFFKSFEKITLLQNNIYFSFSKGFFELINVTQDIEINIFAIDSKLFSKLSFKFNRLDVYQILISSYLKKFTISTLFISELGQLFNLLQLNLIKQKSKFNETILLSLLSVIIYSTLESISEQINIPNQGKMNRKQELVFSFFNLLSTYYKVQRNISFYAKKLKVSTRYLSLVVKGVIGKTANQVIHEYVITEAKLLLGVSNKKIIEIASELNFNDQYYFSNFFKKHTGFSPSEFKQKNKKDYIYTSI